MSSLLDRLSHLNGVVVYLVVAALVFAEDALFVGFVLPGETAAVLGGVIASQGRVQLWLMIVLVVAAAIVGDTVGYEIGRHVGPRILRLRILDKRRRRLDDAQEFLRRRGGWAVFLGRFVAFFPVAGHITQQDKSDAPHQAAGCVEGEKSPVAHAGGACQGGHHGTSNKPSDAARRSWSSASFLSRSSSGGSVRIAPKLRGKVTPTTTRLRRPEPDQ